MLGYGTILTASMPVYLAMLCGALMRAFRFLPTEVDKGMMRLVVTVLSPCLILHRIVGNEAVMKVLPVAVAAVIGFGLAALGIAVSYLLGPLAGLKVGEGRRTFAVACGLQNYGFVAIPIVDALFPGKGAMGVLFTFTLGVELACWTCGVGVLTGFSKAPWKLALNPPVIAILTALMINFSGLHAWMPVFLMNTFGLIGACAVPLAVLLIGAAIADIIGLEKMQVRTALLSPLIRLGLLPLSFVAVAYWLPLSVDLKRIIVVQAAMPSAVFNIMVARMYGGHAATSVQVVVATTLVSVVTIPLMVG
jgi:predicted permease